MSDETIGYVQVRIKDESHREAIRRALEDPEVYAFALIVGTVLPMPERAQAPFLASVQNIVATHNALAEAAADERLGIATR
jgi:hypothetical protein